MNKELKNGEAVQVRSLLVTFSVSVSTVKVGKSDSLNTFP